MEDDEKDLKIEAKKTYRENILKMKIMLIWRSKSFLKRWKEEEEKKIHS